MKNVDVVCSLYGKPYQSALTLLSLLKYSGEHIDNLYLIIEKEQPHNDNINFVLSLFPNAIIFTPTRHLGYSRHNPKLMNNPDYRLSIRYQFAWEHTNKDYLFITHNDCLYSSDIIGGMLERIGESDVIGVGQVGQCWNCPANYAKTCSGDNYFSYRPTYEEVVRIVTANPSPRTRLRGFDKKRRVDKINPMPLPECRLNEFYCLVDVKKAKPLTFPFGKAMPFGVQGLDIGTDWFRSMTLSGYRCINWYGGVQHAYIANKALNIPCGHLFDASNQRDAYYSAEEVAKAYLHEHFKV